MTRHSVIAAAQSADLQERGRALEAITAAYWRPVYKYVRLRWQLEREDAEDFTQEFFARLLEKEFLDSYRASRGRLRTFLRTCVDRQFMNQLRDARRQKRGSAAMHLSLDFAGAERELAAATGVSPEDAFEREWTRTIFARAVETLREECERTGKATHYALFELRDLADADVLPSYAELAARFNLAVTDVTNYLAFARKEFRRAALNQLRRLTGSEEEFRREAQALLGIDMK